MKQLDNLADITNRNLAGLTATPTLLAKIKLEAANSPSSRSVRILRPALAVCAALVLCLGTVATLKPSAPVATVDALQTANLLDSHAAGFEMAVSEEMHNLGELPKGSISMSTGSRHSTSTLFAPATATGFPLINISGAVYRLLETPSTLSDALLGKQVAIVQEYNVKSALSQGCVMSNIVSTGESIHAIQGAGGALVAAQANGALRVFQRVSYAGTAIIGTETFADTLCASETVAWMEMEGVGRVEGAQAQELMKLLLADASYQSTAMGGEISMQIGLRNGLILQLMAEEGCVSACGTWNCPAFFEAFENAVEN